MGLNVRYAADIFQLAEDQEGLELCLRISVGTWLDFTSFHPCLLVFEVLMDGFVQ